MTYDAIFNTLATVQLQTLAIFFGGFAVANIYSRYKFGKSAMADIPFNIMLIVFNWFVIVGMQDDRTPKSPISLFVFGIAIVQLFKLLKDTIGEIADGIYNSRIAKREWLDKKIEMHMGLLDNFKDSNDEKENELKLKIANEISELIRERSKYN